jgi:hypothetical protein
MSTVAERTKRERLAQGLTEKVEADAETFDAIVLALVGPDGARPGPEHDGG